ncbi:hypothetical protein [Tsuneonella sp. HG222]
MDANHGSIARAQAQRTGKRGLGLGMIGVALALILAVLAVIWWRGYGTGDLVRIVDEAPAAVAIQPSPPMPSASTTARQDAAQVARVVEQQGGLDSRVAAMEQRIANLDLQTQAAAGNAARAEGLLITFAARRAVDRGQPLGYLGDQLRLRFGDARPNAVNTVLDASEQPVTLDQLVAKLDGLAPALATATPRNGMMSWLGNELSSLFVVRREDTPSPQPQRRLERARMFLQSSRVEAAMAEVRNLPNAASAREWLAEADRYARVQRALDLLETTAILESRGLKDGAGNPVEQLSPAT